MEDLFSPLSIAACSDEILSLINVKLSGHRAIEFCRVSVGDRRYQIMLSYKVESFDLCLGPEICRDWIQHREGHGFPVAKICETWNTIKRLKIEPTSTDGHLAFQFGTNRRLVTDASRRVVITYFGEEVRRI